MKELANKINETITVLTHNLNLNVDGGNKAAGARARKASLELEKQLKEYRKRSVNPAEWA